MNGLNLQEHPHRRYNILTGEYVLVSPHRTKRPWQGKQEKPATKEAVAHDPNCYLCAGNERVGGVKNPNYRDTFVFKNDFGALLSNTSTSIYESGLLSAEGESGICKVICFSPNHSLTIPDMEIRELMNVVNTWQREFSDLAAIDSINYVQIFENKGAIMGCSNPHPHGQIWAQHSIPTEIIKKTAHQKEYFLKTGKSLLETYCIEEIKNKERIISENEHFVTLVPFWAVWPFEAMIIPKRHMNSIEDLSEAEKKGFAEALKNLTQKYDALFQTSFPYSAGIHQSPTDGKQYPEWHWHMSFYPPLLRSATVKKFMVGYEMFAMPQRDISAESAASRLRNL